MHGAYLLVITKSNAFYKVCWATNIQSLAPVVLLRSCVVGMYCYKADSAAAYAGIAVLKAKI